MIKIQKFKKSNLDEVISVLKKAFYKEGKSDKYNEWNFAKRILDDNGYIKDLCFKALYNKKIVGYNILTKADINNKVGLVLGPLAVLPDYQKRSIGKRLVKYSIKEAKRLNYPWIIVLGGPYYKQFGFKKALDYNIIIEKGSPINEHLKILSLNKKVPKGKIKFCNSFYDENGKLL